MADVTDAERLAWIGAQAAEGRIVVVMRSHARSPVGPSFVGEVADGAAPLALAWAPTVGELIDRLRAALDRTA